MCDLCVQNLTDTSPRIYIYFASAKSLFKISGAKCYSNSFEFKQQYNSLNGALDFPRRFSFFINLVFLAGLSPPAASTKQLFSSADHSIICLGRSG